MSGPTFYRGRSHSLWVLLEGQTLTTKVCEVFFLWVSLFQWRQAGSLLGTHEVMVEGEDGPGTDWNLSNNNTLVRILGTITVWVTVNRNIIVLRIKPGVKSKCFIYPSNKNRYNITQIHYLQIKRHYYYRHSEGMVPVNGSKQPTHTNGRTISLQALHFTINFMLYFSDCKSIILAHLKHTSITFPLF